jgi:acetyltransferase-like isoleucine patch superfamily enzyme
VRPGAVEDVGLTTSIRRNWRAPLRRLADERWIRRVGSDTARDLTPPLPSAFAAFGAGSSIASPARVLTPGAITVGSDVVIEPHAWLSVVEALPGIRPRLEIGDGCRIGRLFCVACVGHIALEEDVVVGERVFIGDTYHRYQDTSLPILDQPTAMPEKVTIKRGAVLSTGSFILLGVKVGEQAWIGPGAVVSRDVPPATLVVGNPARPVARYDGPSGGWVPLRS